MKTRALFLTLALALCAGLLPAADFIPRRLDQQLDVTVIDPAPTNGQVLTYSTATGKWIVATPAAPDLSGYVVVTRTVNSHALSANVSVTAADGSPAATP